MQKQISIGIEKFFVNTPTNFFILLGNVVGRGVAETSLRLPTTVFVAEKLQDGDDAMPF